MIEPSSNATALGALAWKALGGLAGVGAVGAGLASIVVMCLMTPRTRKEWVVGLISTVVGSIGGGAAIIMKYHLQPWMENPVGLIAVLGLVFACGLPAWAIVRWSFNFFDQRRSHDIKQIVDEIMNSKNAGM